MKQELKIAIEDMTRCAGSCQGCVLTDNERKSVNRWDDEGWRQLGSFLRAWFNHAEQNLIDGQLDELAVNFGQGDHFLLTPEDADRMIKWTAETFDGKASAFITASGVTGHERLKSAAKSFHEASVRYNQSLMIDVILDPVSLGNRKFSRIYQDNLDFIRETFGGMDLNINISPEVVRAITPSTLDSFLKENGFSIVTINMVPTMENSLSFSQEWSHMIHWLDEFINLYPDGAIRPYVNNYMATLANHTKRIHDTEPMVDSVFNNALRSIYVASDHRVFFSQAGVGDIPMSERTSGLRSICSIEDGFDHDLIEKKAKLFSAKVVHPFMSKSCYNCEFNRVCTLNGAYALRNTISYTNRNDSCPVGMKGLIKSAMKRYDEAHCTALVRPMAQKGIDKENLKQNPIDCPVMENPINVSVLGMESSQSGTIGHFDGK